MQQTFFEVLQGHKIEFNRLMYPVHYRISTRDAEVAGDTFSLSRNETGTWVLNETENLPGWMNDIIGDLNSAICQNEMKLADQIY